MSFDRFDPQLSDSQPSDSQANREFAQLWESTIPGIELYCAHLSRHRFGKHFHDSYTIGINLSGEGRFQHQGQNYLAVPGSFHLINPGTVHTGEVSPQMHWHFCDLYLSLPLVEQVLMQLEWQGQFPVLCGPVVIDRSLQAQFHRLFHALSQPVSLLEQQTLLLQALSQLFRRHASCPISLNLPRCESKAVAQVRAYLEAHYREAISIETLATLVNLSPFYLIRSFQQQIGLPPHAYQRQWQVLQAKRSLRAAAKDGSLRAAAKDGSLRSSKSLAEIALEHGFYDQSHLNRSFKQTFGTTPGQYRKSNFVQDR